MRNLTYLKWPRGIPILIMLVTAILVACGSSSTATPLPTATPPATNTPVPGEPTNTPRPTATATTAPTAPITVSGKVTILTGVWGNEWFYPEGGLGEVAGYGRQLHGQFIEGNEDVELIPGILSKWEISEDGLTWNLTLRKEPVKFHNGDLLNIEDVRFSIDHTAGTATEGDVTAGAEPTQNLFQSLEITGPDTVAVTTTQPVAFFAFFILSALGPANFGGALPKKYFEEVGLEGYNKNPVGAGAFSMETYKPREQMLMERFDDYYYQPDNGLPEDRRSEWQTLDRRLVPEVATRVAALQAGDADIIQANTTVANQIEGAGGRIVFARESSYYWIFPLGCWDPELACNSKEFRLALDYAINKQLIVDRFYADGVGQVKGYVGATPSSLGYSPELDPFPFDQAKAEALLVEAGFPGGEGVPKITIHTWKAGDVPFMPEVGEVIASMWRNVGIDAEVQVGDATSVRVRWQGRELDGGYLLRPNEARFDGISLATGGYADTENKVRRAEDPVLRDLVLQTIAVTDPAERDQAVNEMWKALREEGYETSLGYVNAPWGVAERIAEWRPWSLAPYETALWTITLK